MRCRYLESDLCHSCTRANVAYAEQLAAKDAAVRALLERSARAKGAAAPEIEWDPPFASAEEGFRNKAKLAVGGTLSAPTLGILGSDKRGIDIAGCPLYEPAVASGIEPLREFIGLAGLTPFDVPSGRGELKSLILTGSPDGELMVRFVLRSTESLVRIRKHMGLLRQWLPHIAVVSVNLLPERKAVLEGEEEILLGPEQSLRMDLGDVVLRLRPQSFFQTNTRVAVGLYRQARKWVGLLCNSETAESADLEAQGPEPAASASTGGRPIELWDLYCGVGGFALHCAGPGRRVTGVELSAQAVESARASAAAAGIDADFIVGDSLSAARELGSADVVAVNPPRRGIGDLASWIDASRIRFVLYSSCNPASLAADVANMPSFTPVRARVFDMFPHTGHTETLVLLARRPRPGPQCLPHHSRSSS